MQALIVARDATAADLIRHVLRYAPTCRVVGWADAGRPCASIVIAADPEVVVLDEGASTLQRAREVRAALPETKLVLLAGALRDALLADAAAAGVNAVISKAASAATIAMLIREVAAGNVFHFAPAASMAGGGAPRKDGLLTDRELEILRRVAAGRSNARIAADLWVTEQTVKFHLSNVYRKLDVANRTEASHYAHVHGLLEPNRPHALGLESAA